MIAESRTAVFARLSFGETYSRAAAVFLDRWDLFLAVGCIVFIPYVAFMITYLGFLGQLTGDAQAFAADAATAANTNDPDNVPDFNAYFAETLAHAQAEVGKVVFEIVLYMFFGIIGGSAISRAVAEIYASAGVTGASPDLVECLRKGFRRFCNLFCATWMVGMAVMAGYVVTIMIVVGLFATKNALCILLAIVLLVAFVVAAIYVKVAMMLATPVVMVENKGPLDTIKRCWELANNNRCFIYCTLFCFFFVYGMASGMVFSIIFSAAPQARFETWGAVLQTAPMIVVLPLSVILSTVVYLSVRVEREGMNRDVLLRDLGDSTELDYAILSAVDNDMPKGGGGKGSFPATNKMDTV